MVFCDMGMSDPKYYDTGVNSLNPVTHLSTIFITATDVSMVLEVDPGVVMRMVVQ